MFDMLIRGADVIDGTGTPAFQADVAVKDGKITLIRNGQISEAKQVIDAAGMCVCPGFIDAHSHGDTHIGQPYTNLSKTTQGITTEIAGHCGESNFPSPADPEFFRQHVEHRPVIGRLGYETTSCFANFRKYMESQPKTTNYQQFVGHRSLRLSAMGFAARTATAKELDTMKGLLREAMESGCRGMTTGLTYPPSGFADEHEITELLKVIEPFDGIYCSHIRNEADDVCESVKEMLDCARNAGVRAHISHHKISGVENWGRSVETLKMVDDAIAAGHEVALDIYPYTACMTGLSVCLPITEFEYGLEARIARLKDPKIRKEIADEMVQHYRQYSQLTDFDDIMVVYVTGMPECNGKTIAEIAAMRGADPFDTYFDLLVETRFAVSAVFFAMHEDDLCRIFMHDRTMIGTDGLVYAMEGDTHPRGYGTFPRAINYFVREKKLVTLEQAIYKMTGLTANWFNVPNKGFVKDGFDADLLIFDPNTIAEGNSFAESTKTAIGISHVIVDGQIVCQNGILTGVYPGKVLLHK